MPPPATAYDLILVGSSFAASFFLHEYLRHAAPGARVLVLERGQRRSHRWQLANPRTLGHEARASIENRTPDKPWVFANVFGGGSNCWWAVAPRMLPADFALRTRYGIGRDWPVGYDALEPFYAEAEELMQVAGPSDRSPFARSRPYPQPPHRFSEIDERLERAFPDAFFHQPTARPTRAVPGGRSACCGSGVCGLCPVDAKFTVLNGMAATFADARVRVEIGAAVQQIETRAGVAEGVRYVDLATGREASARGELVVLGAGALFNPHILLRSGLDGPHVGQGLVEQLSVEARAELDGAPLGLGSTSITGHGYMFYDGPHRAERAAALLETWSTPLVSVENGRVAQHVKLKLVYEDLPQPQNRVRVSAADPTKPAVEFVGRSRYAERSVRRAPREFETLAAALPVRRLLGPWRNETESHILGTTVMGDDPTSSVVDADLVHHRVRNLLVVGASVFPTAAPANPTLTLCALSLRAARRLRARAA